MTCKGSAELPHPDLKRICVELEQANLLVALVNLRPIDSPHHEYFPYQRFHGLRSSHFPAFTGEITCLWDINLLLRASEDA